MVDKFQWKVGDTVETRQLERTSTRELMARICRVIHDVHAVQSQHVVVERELCAVIVEPEGSHLFLRVSITAKSIEARVAIRVEIVFPETGSEEVARETIAL